jgi:hypothetical protein
VVKVGFIVEGDSEKVVVESASFGKWLSENGFSLVAPVINAKGGGNLLPQNVSVFLQRLQQAGAERVAVITDLEREVSVNDVRTRVDTAGIDAIFVAVKALEAWFLADTDAMRRWLNVPDFFEPQPECTPDLPWQRLKDVASTNGSRGPGSKAAFAKRFTRHHGFDINRSAQHPECPSARELVDYFSTAATED